MGKNECFYVYAIIVSSSHALVNLWFQRMRSNIRQFVQIVLVFIVGWILGHVFKTSTGDLNCTDRSPFVIEKGK